MTPCSPARCRAADAPPVLLEVLERALGALHAEIAGDRVLEVVDGDGGRKRPATASVRASRGTKIAAWMRSSGTGARDSEPSTKNSVLIDRLHNTP